MEYDPPRRCCASRSGGSLVCFMFQFAVGVVSRKELRDDLLLGRNQTFLCETLQTRCQDGWSSVVRWKREHIHPHKSNNNNTTNNMCDKWQQQRSSGRREQSRGGCDMQRLVFHGHFVCLCTITRARTSEAAQRPISNEVHFNQGILNQASWWREDGFSKEATEQRPISPTNTGIYLAVTLDESELWLQCRWRWTAVTCRATLADPGSSSSSEHVGASRDPDVERKTRIDDTVPLRRLGVVKVLYKSWIWLKTTKCRQFGFAARPKVSVFDDLRMRP